MSTIFDIIASLGKCGRSDALDCHDLVGVELGLGIEERGAGNARSRDGVEHPAGAVVIAPQGAGCGSAVGLTRPEVQVASRSRHRHRPLFLTSESRARVRTGIATPPAMGVKTPTLRGNFLASWKRFPRGRRRSLTFNRRAAPFGAVSSRYVSRRPRATGG